MAVPAKPGQAKHRGIWPHFPKDADSEEFGGALSLEKGISGTWHYEKKTFSTALGAKTCPALPSTVGRGEPSPAASGWGAMHGEPWGALAAVLSCRAVCGSCFICCGVCIVGACIRGLGLNPASGWVLVRCRYLVRTMGLSEVFFPCWPLEETLCPRVPCHNTMLLI